MKVTITVPTVIKVKYGLNCVSMQSTVSCFSDVEEFGFIQYSSTISHSAGCS